MSTQWTAPGAQGSGEPSPPSSADGGPFGPQPTDGAPGQHSAPPSGGPRRELVQAMPLFPLRPLGLGEVLGAAVRIYRLRARSVLGVAAAVYGVAFVIMTFATGASMVPMIGDMQAVFEDPETTTTGLGSLRDVVLMVVSSVVTMIVSLLSSALVTVALTRVALGEAVGDHVSTADMWATMRRRGLPAVAVVLLIGLLSTVAFVVLLGLGMLPLILLQEATAVTITLLVIGLVAAVLASLWVWARTVLAIPALVLEEAGVLGSLRRSFAMTRGRRLWRVLGTTLLLYLLYMIAVQVIVGVFSTIAMLAYVAILLISSFEAMLLGMTVLTILSMVGSYAATFLLAPFLSAGYVAVYADNRMRHEAWDVELTRRARAHWDGTGIR
ncbi:glycerophosphoryl diester phosphodiesterase membrane domain-containing protein [Brachybacterium sp. AOP42-C2-15]|uniref:glycerophosphoryl diester phosphodiesterase membrane domain-containing protein n=1 Tax=Brachybacterium sp. AOP42-C2-15 TaxID=3457670 RepID=UPI003FDB7C92